MTHLTCTRVAPAPSGQWAKDEWSATVYMAESEIKSAGDDLKSARVENAMGAARLLTGVLARRVFVSVDEGRRGVKVMDRLVQVWLKARLEAARANRAHKAAM